MIYKSKSQIRDEKRKQNEIKAEDEYRLRIIKEKEEQEFIDEIIHAIDMLISARISNTSSKEEREELKRTLIKAFKL